MGWATTIKTGCKTVITANTTLDEASVYDRPEDPMDERPATMQVFMRELPIKPNKVAGALRFKIYPIEFTLVFDEPKTRTDETETDPIRALKDEYNEALYAALKTTNPWLSGKISDDVIQVDDVSRDLDPVVEPAVLAKRGDLHRIRQAWDFSVNEN